ncbi:MAG TPA: DUF86 domain-containing protein [Candidatus Cloacimonadota bacterium]|nr:DUF86 domain-containing protein [Candidatus Cloacimonadota bacterium]
MQSNDELCLQTIKDSIDKIVQYTVGIKSYRQFIKDDKSIYACLMQLINIGETVGRLSEEITSDESAIEWRKIRGLRNILAHDYYGVDHREIWSIISIHIPTLKKVVEGFLE